MQPSLDRLAEYLGISKYHLQRTFSEWAGVSPKQFMQFLTKEYAKSILRNTPILESALSCGLSGGSRLHDLFIKYESVTPGEYKTMGTGLEIFYGVHSSPIGYCFIAITHRGICKLSFVEAKNTCSSELNSLALEWPKACIIKDQETTKNAVNKIFYRDENKQDSLNLILKGSAFQLKVWEALLKIPAGEIYSYQSLATSMHKPNAVRAVASAVAKNNIAYLVPCHRVIRATGILNHYRWGANRKAAMIGLEAAFKLTKQSKHIRK